MATTIQVTEEVLGYLKNMKDKSKAESLNEVIKTMIRMISRQDSLYGFLKAGQGSKVKKFACSELPQAKARGAEKSFQISGTTLGSRPGCFTPLASARRILSSQSVRIPHTKNTDSVEF